MKLQKKTLEHVSGLLKNFDTYPSYSKMGKLLDELNIVDPQRAKILDLLNEENSKLRSIAMDSEGWVDAILEDLNK